MKKNLSEIQFNIHSGNESDIGEVVLNRPDRLNALSTKMIHALMDHLKSWAADDAIAAVMIRSAVDQVFCSGGDIAYIYQSMGNHSTDARAFFEAEYALNLQMAQFSKPIISIINGVAMGGGLGLCIHGSHRVGGEGLMMAMPECRIGFIPDVGAGYFLSRLPGLSGLMMGLSSASIDWGDALAWGLLTHAVASSDLDSVLDVLCRVHWSDYPHQDVSQALSEIQIGSLPHGVYDSHLSMMDKFFSAASVADVIRHCMDGPPWSVALAKQMCRNYPLSMAIFFRHYHAMTGKDLLYDLKQTFILAQKFLNDSNFSEGIRAAVIDKDRCPRWKGPGLNDIDSIILDQYFNGINVVSLCIDN